MPGKGHYKVYAYQHSLWHTAVHTKDGLGQSFDIYDLAPDCPWWDARGWTYRCTKKVAVDPYSSEPEVPQSWQLRAYAYTEWDWYSHVPIGTDLWVSCDGTYWEVWSSPALLEDCFRIQPYAGWRLLEKDVYFPK